MRRLGSLAVVLLLVLLAGSGCTTEDRRQWHEAMRDWRGDNIKFGSRDRSVP